MFTFFKSRYLKSVAMSLILVLVVGSGLAQDKNSVRLAFGLNAKILYSNFGNNQAQLSKIYNLVSINKTALLTGQSHLNIVCYIYPSQVGNSKAINNASYQGSVVRALFRTRYGIPHSSTTFYIDTTEYLNNTVRIEYLATAVGQYDNQDIYYSRSGSSSSMLAAMMDYRPTVPYTSSWMQQAKDSFEELPKEVAAEPQKPQSKEPEHTTCPMVEVAEKEFYVQRPAKTVIGIKTNLMDWLTLTPNLDLEFYMGQRTSLVFDGAYTDLWFLPQDQRFNRWKMGLELRLYLRGQKQFSGHFFGLYGGVGHLDIAHKNVVDTRGCFYGAGITYGYVLPIKRGFCMEFSLSGGWAQYGKNKNSIFQVNLSDRRYWGLTGVNISLLWKL
ncbi:MAG: DUF3575 domain-containing protein [Mucinivorans sp.]